MQTIPTGMTGLDAHPILNHSAGDMTGNIQAIIFDMDGILIDSEPVHIHAWQKVLTGMGHYLPPDWFYRYIGVGDVEVSPMISSRLELDLPAENFLCMKREAFDELSAGELKAFPGVAEGIGKLKIAGYRTALCTGSPRKNMDQVLGTTGLGEGFELKFSCDDYGKCKPSPDPYLQLMDRMGLQPGACMIIEDSEVGLQAARDSGARVLAVMGVNVFDRASYAEQVFEQTAEAIDWILSN